MKKKTPMKGEFIYSVVFILLLPMLLLTCKNKQVLPTKDEAKAAVWQKIQMENDRWAAGDPMGFLEYAAKDIIWSDDLGAQNRVIGYDSLKTYLEAFKGQVPPHQHELIEPVFQIYDDIVIVSYRYQGILEGESLPPWKVTSVFRYADGEWLSVHENWTDVS
ncbi:MAG: nuclear transport factor 2 family protein [Bacteroidales bacterium]|jgi:hypothetical protein|nr:nuclear transport factor 2 family protein [Bacteroidales bacterium]